MTPGFPEVEIYWYEEADIPTANPCKKPQQWERRFDATPDNRAKRTWKANRQTDHLHKCCCVYFDSHFKHWKADFLANCIKFGM